MTNRIQSLRSNVAGARPSGQIPGTIYTNFADRQIGVVSPTNAPLDMVAVRFFSTTASYVLGDYVVNGGQIYRAPGPIAPGVFNPGAWVPIGNAMFDQSLNTFDTVRFAKLGIGMVPVTILDLAASQDSSAIIRLTNADAGTSASASLRASNGAQYTALYQLGVNSPATGVQLATGGLLLNTGNGLGVQTGGPIMFASGGSAERMRIDAAGYVGIGTAPGVILDIKEDKASGSYAQLTNLNAGGYCGFQVRNSSNSGGILHLGTSYPTSALNRADGTYLYGTGVGGLTVYTQGAQPIYFGTSSVERMRIDAAGNVGIGAANPASYYSDQTLVVAGATNGAIMIAGPAAGSPGLYFAHTENPALQKGWVLYGNANDSMRFGTNNTERMRIDAAGNVGIGTSSVTNMGGNIRVLDIQGTDPTRGGGITLRSSDSSLSLQFFAADGITYAGSASAHPFALMTGGTERMRIDAAGTVTVKNFTDQKKAIAVVGPSYALRLGSDPSGANIDGTDVSGNQWGPLSVGGSSVSFQVVGAERGRFEYISGGNAYFRASSNGSYANAGLNLHELYQSVPGNLALSINNASASPYGFTIVYTAAAPNDSTYFAQFSDTASPRFYFFNHGGMSNFSANNGNLSDARLKEQITIYSDAELSALEASFLQVKWGKWKFSDQTHTDWNHGTTAQGIEEAFALTAPELVDEIDMAVRSGPSDTMTPAKMRKTIYETDLTNITRALLARALTRIDQLEKLLIGKPMSA